MTKLFPGLCLFGLLLTLNSCALTEAKTAPDWALPDAITGKTVRLSDFRGKIVVLNFWATWCPPCRAEIPELVRLQTKYGGPDFALIGISLDLETADQVRPFLKQAGINYPVVLGTEPVASDYGAQMIPLTYLLDREGHLVSRHALAEELPILAKEIDRLLKPGST